MKKAVIPVVIVIASFLYFVYGYIPNEMSISMSSYSSTPVAALSRAFIQVEEWKNWMPNKLKDQNTFELSMGQLKVKEGLIASVKSDYQNIFSAAPIEFQAIGYQNDSSMIQFHTVVNNYTTNPFTRIANYYLAKGIQTDLQDVLNQSAVYYSNVKNLYGFDIQLKRVKDSSLVSTNQVFPDTPSNRIIYTMIEKLQNHVKQHNGVIHGDPMVNITQLDNEQVYVQVGLALEKDIPVSGDIQLKKMVLGNILETKVVGDQHEVNRALAQTKSYIFDYKKSSPAIFFITFNTNRLQVVDSTKWLSTIYFPVY